MTDVDGNIYNTVEIGSQCWMKENLRVSANVPNVVNPAPWSSLTSPAWCYYNNDSSYGVVYGKLYNWYAANSGNLCPLGWHISTDNDWKILSVSLGMSQFDADQVGWYGESANVGGQLKSTTTNWNQPNIGATNSSGFTALPGGRRIAAGGYFNSLGTLAIFWTQTQSFNVSNGWFRSLTINTNGLFRDQSTGIKEEGYYCRCVKD